MKVSMAESRGVPKSTASRLALGAYFVVCAFIRPGIELR